jgi:hypothetical protein
MTASEGEYSSAAPVVYAWVHAERLLPKVRVTGGIWKLYLLYEALSRPAAGDQAKDKDTEWA